MPFRWTINPYRGCEFGCKYCYARYSTNSWSATPLSSRPDLCQKRHGRNFAARAAENRQTRSHCHWTATDPYQPAERRFGRTHSILEVFAKRAQLARSITTKSDLIQRDVALLAEIGRANVLDVKHHDHYAQSRPGADTRAAARRGPICGWPR